MNRITARPLTTPWTTTGSRKKKSNTARLLSRWRGRLKMEPGTLCEFEALPRSAAYQEARVGDVAVGHGRKRGHLGGDRRPERTDIVHRLDRYTSGVLLVAKNDDAHRRLAAQFSGRQVEKVYLALVHGKVKHESGRMERPIARDPVRRTRMTTRLDKGRAAWSEYRVLRRFERFTLLEVRIGTGRTHQIRVHLSSIGHPVAGDTLYGAPAKVEGRPPLGRFFLHARRIRFHQPIDGRGDRGGIAAARGAGVLDGRAVTPAVLPPVLFGRG